MRRVAFVWLAVCAVVVGACGVQTADTVDVDSKPLVMPKTQASARKIIAFGDSLTAGFGVEMNQS